MTENLEGPDVRRMQIQLFHPFLATLLLFSYPLKSNFLKIRGSAISSPHNTAQQWCSGKYLFGGKHGERGARAYNGGLGAVPPAGSRGRAPGGGQGVEAPLKLKSFYVLDMQ